MVAFQWEREKKGKFCPRANILGQVGLNSAFSTLILLNELTELRNFKCKIVK